MSDRAADHGDRRFKGLPSDETPTAGACPWGLGLVSTRGQNWVSTVCAFNVPDKPHRRQREVFKGNPTYFLSAPVTSMAMEILLAPAALMVSRTRSTLPWVV